MRHRLSGSGEDDPEDCASSLFEKLRCTCHTMSKTFVAALARRSEVDVTPHVFGGAGRDGRIRPDTGSPREFTVHWRRRPGRAARA